MAARIHSTHTYTYIYICIYIYVHTYIQKAKDTCTTRFGGSFWCLPLLSMHNNCYLQQFADVINIYCCFILSACKYEQRQLGLGLGLEMALAMRMGKCVRKRKGQGCCWFWGICTCRCFLWLNKHCTCSVQLRLQANNANNKHTFLNIQTTSSQRSRV